jgi:hypothetical protein
MITLIQVGVAILLNQGCFLSHQNLKSGILIFWEISVFIFVQNWFKIGLNKKNQFSSKN